MLRRSKDLKEFNSRLAHILLVPKDIVSNELAGKHAKHATRGTDPQDESVPFRAAKTAILKEICDQPTKHHLWSKFYNSVKQDRDDAQAKTRRQAVLLAQVR